MRLRRAAGLLVLSGLLSLIPALIVALALVAVFNTTPARALGLAALGSIAPVYVLIMRTERYGGLTAVSKLVARWFGNHEGGEAAVSGAQEARPLGEAAAVQPRLQRGVPGAVISLPFRFARRISAREIVRAVEDLQWWAEEGPIGAACCERVGEGAVLAAALESTKAWQSVSAFLRRISEREDFVTLLALTTARLRSHGLELIWDETRYVGRPGPLRDTYVPCLIRMVDVRRRETIFGPVYVELLEAVVLGDYKRDANVAMDMVARGQELELLSERPATQVGGFAR